MILKKNIPFKYQASTEQEVVGFFCLIANQLDFEIIHISIAFPDCKAIKISTGKEVNIEFEYYSSNFIDHGHSVEGCDYIICWEKDIDLIKPQVISIKEYFSKLPVNPSLNKKGKINIHQTVILKASDSNGLSYPELINIFNQLNNKNSDPPARIIGRLFKWGYFPYADNGYLKLKNNSKPGEYKIENDKIHKKLGEELLELLKYQWNENIVK